MGEFIETSAGGASLELIGGLLSLMALGMYALFQPASDDDDSDGDLTPDYQDDDDDNEDDDNEDNDNEDVDDVNEDDANEDDANKEDDANEEDDALQEEVKLVEESHDDVKLKVGFEPVIISNVESVYKNINFENLDSMTLKELQNYAREHNIKIKGRKTDLIDRIKEQSL